MAAPSSKPKSKPSSGGAPKSSASHGGGMGGTGLLAMGVGAVVAGILLCNPFACAATLAGVGAVVAAKAVR